MKQYARISSLLFLVAFVALGIYLKFSGGLLSAPASAIQIGKVENCAPANNVCVIEFNGKSIGFHLPNDAAYLKDFPVEVHLHGFAEQQIKSAQLDFIMPGMNMGLNRIRLQERNFQLWSGTGKLAVCLSRRTDWLAKVMLNIDNNIYQAEFLFKVDINN